MDANIRYQLVLASIDLLKYLDQTQGKQFEVLDVLSLAATLSNFVF